MSAHREIRHALASALRPLGIEPASYVLTPPGVEVSPAAAKYDEPGRGMHDLRFTVTVLAGPIDDPSAQDLLDDLLAIDGDRSARATLNASADPGGPLHRLVDDVRAVSCTGYQAYTRPAGPVLGAAWQVQIIVS